MFARFFPRSVGQFCKQHGLDSTEQFLHGFNNLQKLASLPISPISNSYVTMSLAAFSLSLDISDFRKQFKTVFVITASQAATNICIPSSKPNFGRVFFISTLWIIFNVQHCYSTVLSMSESQADPFSKSEKLCPVEEKTTWLILNSLFVDAWGNCCSLV